VPQANEDAVLEAINAIENRNRELESTLTAQRNQITALETEKTNLTTTVNTLKTEKEAAEKAAKKVNAEALVKAAVNLKTIKNDAETIAKWTDRAIADYDGTKDLLESIPVNQVSNRIKVGEQGNKGGAQVSELDNAVALEMARIQNRLNGRTEVK
jgi:chromosome segregation ATPase